jgi:hypothetical protein
MPRFAAPAAAAWIGCLLVCGPGFGQSSSGTISGRVLDPTGQAIPDATVTVTRGDTGETHRVTTASDGAFVLTSLQPATYRLQVTAGGFKNLDKDGMELSASERLAAGDLKMQVGSLSESVVVKAEVTAVQSVSSERSALLDHEQVTSLMSRGRDVMAMLAILPGTVYDGEGNDTLGVMNSPAAMQGVRGVYNGMNVDGISGNTRSGDHLDTPLNMDAIAEVKVLQNSYQAEYGKGSGSIINVVTRGGTRVFHGGAYYFIRNEDLNANNFFNNQAGTPRARYRYNTFGYNAGGPVSIPNHFNKDREKLFFFFSQEISPNMQPNSLRNYTVPTALERSGDFSQSGVTIKDPFNNNAAFPGNVIPANRVDPNMQKLVNLFPLPNFTNTAISKGQYNFQVSDSEQKPVAQEILRLDYYATSKLRISFRGMDMVNHNKGLNSTTDKYTWATNIGPMDYSTTGPNLGTTITYTISPTVVNELVAGYALWTENQIIDSSVMSKLEKKGYGITLGQIYPANNPLGILPAMSFGGVTNAATTSYDARFPMQDDASTWSLSDTLSKVWKQHLFKVGVQGEYVVYNQFHTGSANFAGAFDFNGATSNLNTTGYAYANALIGEFNTYTESNNRDDYSPVTPILEGFVQDTWRVTPRLTLELGMRFTAGIPQYPSNNAAATFVPSLYHPANAPLLYQPILNSTKQRVAVDPRTGTLYPASYIGLLIPGTGNPDNGIVVSGTAGYPQSLVDYKGILPAPRLGFAWDPFGDGKTAIRGGGGFMYNPRNGSGILGDLSANPPLILNPAEYYGTTATFLTATGINGVSGFKHSLNRANSAPVAYNASFGIQRNVGFDTVIDVAYVGSFGRHIGQTRDINAIPYGARGLPQNLDPTNSNKPYPDNFFRQYQGYASIPFLNFDGNSSYHSLEIQANKRFSHGLQFGTAFTWSKAMDYDEGDQGTIAANLPRTYANYGLAAYNRARALTFYYTYDLPRASRVVNHRVVRTALDGWELHGITRFVTGGPLYWGGGSSSQSFLGTGNLTSGADITLGGDGWRPVAVGKAVLPDSQRGYNQWFNTDAFVPPPVNCTGIGCIGTSGPVIANGPGTNNFNLSLVKRFAVREKYRAEFRAEAYNAFNHTQWSAVNTSPKWNQTTGQQTNGQFGEPTSARDPRILQFGLKLSF